MRNPAVTPYFTLFRNVLTLKQGTLAQLRSLDFAVVTLSAARAHKQLFARNLNASTWPPSLLTVCFRCVAKRPLPSFRNPQYDGGYSSTRCVCRMADIDLTQAEADNLMEMEKKAVDDREWLFPGAGDRIVVPLTSTDKRENFLLDVTRYQIKLTKATFQNRARMTITLYRLDIDGAPHRNPDGKEIPCPHLHIYREGYGDKWAVPAPVATFPDTTNVFTTLDAFMQHCKITEPPKIQKGLFS
jgi:hypothetical protein